MAFEKLFRECFYARIKIIMKKKTHTHTHTERRLKVSSGNSEKVVTNYSYCFDIYIKRKQTIKKGKRNKLLNERWGIRIIAGNNKTCQGVQLERPVSLG